MVQIVMSGVSQNFDQPEITLSVDENENVVNTLIIVKMKNLDVFKGNLDNFKTQIDNLNKKLSKIDTGMDTVIDINSCYSSIEGENNIYQLLSLCVAFNQKDKFDYLLKKSTIGNIEEALLMSCNIHNRLYFFEKLSNIVSLKDKSWYMPLSTACNSGNIEIVKLIIQSGQVDVNYTDSNSQFYAPLIIAIEKRYNDIAKVLIENGANVNIKTELNDIPEVDSFDLSQELIMDTALVTNIDNMNNFILSEIGRNQLSRTIYGGETPLMIAVETKILR